MKKLTALLIALILAAMCASCAKPAETPAENPAEPAPAAQAGETAEAPAPAGTEPAGTQTARYEGGGFDTPEDAVMYYLDGLRNLDFEQMLGAFAWETMMDRYSSEAYFERLNAYTTTVFPPLPGTGSLVRDLNLELMREGEAEKIFRSLEAWLLDGTEENPGNGYNVQLTEPGAVQAYLEQFKSEKPERLASLTDIRFLPAAEALGGTMTDEQIRENTGRQYAMYGADELVNVPAAGSLGDMKLFVAPLAARYGSRWYLVTLDSLAASVLGLSQNQRGFAVLPELPKGRAEDFPVRTAPAADSGKGRPAGIRYEGEGFDTPEAAMDCYMQGLKDRDLGRILRAFAWETLAERYSLADQLERVRYIGPRTAARLPKLNPFLVRADLHSLRREYMTMIALSVATLFVGDDIGMTISPLEGAYGEFFRGLYENDRTEVLAGITNVRYLPPAEVAGDAYNSEKSRENRERMYACFGADETADVTAAADLPDGGRLTACATAARYGGRWYLVSFGSQAASFAAVPVNEQAFSVRREAEDSAAQPPEPAPEPETPAQRAAEIMARAEACLAAAETGLANVRGYMDQIRKDAAAAESAGYDASWLGENVREAEKALEDAEKSWEAASDRYSKMKDLVSETEDADETYSKVVKSLNMIQAQLKKITKIDKYEAYTARSAETRIRLISEKIREEIAAAYPELDLGGAFTPEPADLSGLGLSE